MSCIHFNIGNSEPEKAKDIDYKSPPSPYERIKNSDTDYAWQSRKTGNMIAISSNCSKNSDKSLQQAFQDVSKGFDRTEDIKQEPFFYNGREALRGIVKGSIDGIAATIDVVLLNKNQCFYQLTYSGVSNQFSEEKNIFENFIKDFKAP